MADVKKGAKALAGEGQRFVLTTRLGAILLMSLICISSLAARSFSPAASTTATYVVVAGANDVNQSDGAFTSNASTLWIGNTASLSRSYTAFRFTSINIPQGAVISSAYLQLYSSQQQWVSMSFDIYGDLAANSAGFSATSLPESRIPTSHSVLHSSNSNWLANTFYNLDDIGPVIQEIVGQNSWQSGNSLSIILHGRGTAWGRKNIVSFEGNAAYAPKLVIVYDSGSSTPATQTLTASPTPTNTSLATATRTPTSTRTPTRTATEAATITNTRTPTITSSPTRTATGIATATNTRTPTATSTALASSTFTATSVLTPTSGTPASITSFAVNTGGSDLIPHQLIRTSGDRLYFFGYAGDDSAVLDTYWTTQNGLPASTSDFGGALSATQPAAIISVAPVYDGNATVHVLTNSKDGLLRDIRFDLTTNSFLASSVLASGLTTANTNVGTSGVAGAIDGAGLLHVVYWSGDNHIIYQKYTYDRNTDTLTLNSGPTQIDSNGSSNHPNIAISPVDGSLTVAWVSQASSPATILVRKYVAGSWGAIQTVSTSPVWISTSAGINIDQGPGLVIALDGTQYLTYIEDYRVSSPFDYGRVHVVINNGSGWSDSYIGYYSHDPAPAIDSLGNFYVIGHGYSFSPAPCNSPDNMCLYTRLSNGSWATPRLIAAPSVGNSFDSSPSVKWSVVGYYRPETVEFVFPEVISGNYANTVIRYGRLDASGGPTPTASPLTPTATPSSSTATFTTTATLAALTPTPTATDTSPAATWSPTPTVTATLTLAAPSITPTPTLTLVNPSPTFTATFTPTATSVSGPQTITLQVNANSDDANEVSGSVDATNSSGWLGNAASTTDSYAGFRFAGVAIPRGAQITSANLSFYSTSNQWISISYTVRGDLAANSQTFSTNAKLSSRVLTSAAVNHSSNVQWLTNTWYQSDNIAAVIQEIVNQSGWQAGNSVSLILRGSGGAWSRKFFATRDGSSQNAPKLVITYQVP